MIRDLRESDFTEKQAEEIVRVPSRSQERLVSTEHFDHEIRILREENKLTRWMLAIIIAVNVLPILKNLL